MSNRGDAEDGSKKRKQLLEVSEGAGGEEVVSVKLENGEVVALSIAKERAENFRDLRQAQRVRFAKFFKQLTDDLQCGKELPVDHELYQYLASTELARLRELASLLAKDKSKPPPPAPRVSKPEFEQAVAILASAHPCHVRNWPKDALYTGRLLNEYDVRTYAQQPNTWPAQPTLETFVEIRPLTSETHPAFPGLGVFAAHPIPANAEIGLYTGILRCFASFMWRSCLTLCQETTQDERQRVPVHSCAHAGDRHRCRTGRQRSALHQRLSEHRQGA